MYMKKWIMICACVAVFQTILAQRITRQYNNVSFSAALKDLNARQHKYTINFVYDELEDFRVTKSIRNQSVPDAIMQLIGFYPIRMTQVEDNIMVECTQKTPTKMIGRIIDNKNRPVDFANVALLNVRDSLRGEKGDSPSYQVDPWWIPDPGSGYIVERCRYGFRLIETDEVHSPFRLFRFTSFSSYSVLSRTGVAW